jgi:hypothetical protein
MDAQRQAGSSADEIACREIPAATTRRAGIGLESPPLARWSVHWSSDVNLGHLLIALTMIGSVFLAYADLKATIAVHDVRLTMVERVQADAAIERHSLFKEIREQLADIQKTLAGKQDRPR